jgi:chemotaxis protein MotB
MLKWLLGVVLVVGAALGALYALLYQPQQEALEVARTETQLCEKQNAALQGRVAELTEMLDELRNTSAELEASVRDKEAELADIRSTQDQLMDELQQEIEAGQVRVERLQDKLRVDVVDEILFDSGEAVLKLEGRAVLAKVAGVLQDANRLVEVQGHTDNVPIRGRLAERFPTNWELSAARAVNVVRFLQEETGLPPTRLSALAMSEYRPRGDNETEQGRKANRRIEILLAPLPETATPTESSSEAPAAPQEPSGE